MRNSFTHVAWLWCALLCFAGSEVDAQTGAADDPLSPEYYLDEEVAESPGVIATYRVGDNDFSKVEYRLQHDWSLENDLRLNANQRFQLAWRGQLKTKGRGQYRFWVHGDSAVTSLEVAGKELNTDQAKQVGQWTVSEPVELAFGSHQFSLIAEELDGASKIAVFWSGPKFSIEPLAGRFLVHEPDKQEGGQYELGATLFRGLRCVACHELQTGGIETPLAAPALTHVEGNLRPSWLVSHLAAAPTVEGTDSWRQMPYYAMHRNSAAAITAALFDASEGSKPSPDFAKRISKSKSRKKKDGPVRASADRGSLIFAKVGCLACHELEQIPQEFSINQHMFGGGRLDHLAIKRTKEFVARWLDDPDTVNSAHQMPLFDLTNQEKLDLTLYLASLGQEDSRNDSRAWGDKDRGAGLIHQFRCGACHQLPEALTQPVQRTALSSTSNWDGGCLQTPNANSRIPGFGLSEVQRGALREYVQHYSTSKRAAGIVAISGEQLIAENNCLSCHSRGRLTGLASSLAEVAKSHPDLAAQLPALAPPSLNSIGDKLKQEAIESSVSREQKPLRDWLEVQMPKFALKESQRAKIVATLIAQDRIPELPSELRPLANLSAVPVSGETAASSLEAQLAGGRLVTSDGFGCQSCHPIGGSEPPKVDLKARGSDLAMLGKRMRASWFHRWVRNPARIVPRMEMPAIQTPAKGVLGGNLDRQLDALWRTLNQPGFEPPKPNAVRLVRNHNQDDLPEFTQLVSGVVEHSDGRWIRPLVFGLPNRNNLLIDLERAEVAAWWIGDVAHQHTRGKTWYWLPGGTLLNESRRPLQRIELVDAKGVVWQPGGNQQFAVLLDEVTRSETDIRWSGRILFQPAERSAGELQGKVRTVPIVQTIGTPSASLNGVSVKTSLQLQPGETVALLMDADLSSSSGGVLHSETAAVDGCRLEDSGPQTKVHVNAQSAAKWISSYIANLPADRTLRIEPWKPKRIPEPMKVVPGFDAWRLPLPPNEMPISMAWDSEGGLYMGSLKGRVLRVVDTDADGFEDAYELISDEIPTPYGLASTEDGLDVLTKFALVRLSPGVTNAPWDTRVLADGWGYTSDYHDWAVGLERDDAGNYFMALPCQQDDRTEVAAKWRGHALKLIPNVDSYASKRAFRIESFAAGLRFPMGIALNRQGKLFTTDNQGNYNPFNELNHLQFGKRYGFINKLENTDGFSPEFESPAVNLPHPWTRSVDGICFLETPAEVLEAGEDSWFGPYEGHLIGCEMNGRALVRMSLQRVGDGIQGAAYMFSDSSAEGGPSFEGPIVCEVAPDGSIYVGNLHDSGWGGGQNTGSIVRLTRGKEALPLGIAEVRAVADGFEIMFTDVVDRELAGSKSSYQLRSYRRVSTPAYGGEDQGERGEAIRSLEVAPSGRQVRIKLDSLREGYVYEINAAAIGVQGQALFPEQAHYTMRQLPER